MRLLHAVHGFAPEFAGGVESYVASIAAAQLARGDDVAVLAGSDRAGGEARIREEEVSGVPVLRLEGLAPHAERLRDRPDGEAVIAGLLRARRPDLVHVHSWLRLVPSLAAVAAGAGIPTVATLHDLGLSCPRVHRLLPDLSFCRRPESPGLCTPCVRRDPWESDEEVADELALRSLFLERERGHLAAVTVPSEAQKRLLEGLGVFDAGALEVLPVSLAFLPGPSAARSGDAAGLAVGHWGNLLPAKGTHLLVEAAASLPEGLGVSLHLWGTAPDPAFEARLRSAAPEGRVVFHGRYRPADLAGFRIDAAAFPALAHESHSFTLDEAFSLGLPVVVSDAGALPERVGGRGLVVRAGDRDELAGALARLAGEPGLLERLRASAPASPPLPFAAHLARLDAVYARALRRGASAVASRPTEAERLLALQRRASRRLRDAVGAREAAARLQLEATEAVRARDADLQRLYDLEVALRREATAVGERLARSEEELERTKRTAAEDRAEVEALRSRLDEVRVRLDAALGETEALRSRRSVRLALSLARILGRG